MDKALRIFFKTGKELESLTSEASQVRLPNVEKLVREFREVLTHRAIAAEALEVCDSPETRKTLSELRAIEQQPAKVRNSPPLTRIKLVYRIL